MPFKKNCPVELIDVGFHGDVPSRYEPGLFLLFRISEGPRRKDLWTASQKKERGKKAQPGGSGEMDTGHVLQRVRKANVILPGQGRRKRCNSPKTEAL